MKLWKVKKEDKEIPCGEKNAAARVKKAAKHIFSILKRHKVLAAFLILLLAAAAAGILIWQKKNHTQLPEQRNLTETAVIEKMDLSNSIGVTGTLATAEGKTGTTTLENIKVTEVYVEVGDEVQEGDIICTFDSSDIEEALADAKSNYAVNQQLDSLNNYETEYADTIEEAEESLQDARDTRDAYRSAYESAVQAEEEALNKLNEVKSQYNTESLKAAYETAAENLKTAIETAAGITITDLDSYISTVSSENNGALPGNYTELKKLYDDAKSAWEKAQNAVAEAETSYQQAQQNTSSAAAAYEQAQSQKESVQEQYDNTQE